MGIPGTRQLAKLAEISKSWIHMRAPALMYKEGSDEETHRSTTPDLYTPIPTRVIMHEHMYISHTCKHAGR